MTRRSLPQVDLFGVIDIETKPDPHAVALLRHQTGSRVPTAAHRIVAVTTLRARRAPDGEWTDMVLTSRAEPDFDEVAILEGTDKFLGELALGNGACVTFNGLNHDLAVLRRRSARHLMFDANGIHDVSKVEHIDLMRALTRGWRDEWPSLKAACAGLAIPVNHMLVGPTTGDISTARRKCETDVVCTFLLLLYELAITHRDGSIVEKGWSALAQLVGHRRQPPHLAQFARALPGSL